MGRVDEGRHGSFGKARAAVVMMPRPFFLLCPPLAPLWMAENRGPLVGTGGDCWDAYRIS